MVAVLTTDRPLDALCTREPSTLSDVTGRDG
jgi:hypothetical protein